MSPTTNACEDPLAYNENPYMTSLATMSSSDVASSNVASCLPEELQGPKMWEDLKSDEKIERTREKVKEINMDLSRRINGLENSIEKLKKHSHQNENVVTPIGGYDSFGDCLQSTRADGKSYF